MTDATCSVPTCKGSVNARGLCGGHYARWRKTGDVQADVPLAVQRPRAGRICTIKDCGEPEECRGWCHRHYTKWRFYGDPLGCAPPPARKGTYPPGSKTPHWERDCETCGTRVLMRAEQRFCSRKCAKAADAGPANSRWGGDEVTYVTLHQRVYNARGKADHCERCGLSDPAAKYQWANLTGRYEDIWDYEQMCIPCHAAYDAPARPRGSQTSHAKLTEERVREARRRQAAGESATSMASEFGVSQVALANAIAGRTWKHVPMESAYRPSKRGPRLGSKYRPRS